MLSDLKTEAKMTGIKQSQKAVAEGRARRAFVAQDAESRLTCGFVELCNAHGVEVEFVPTMKELGSACDIEVGASVAVLLA